MPWAQVILCMVCVSGGKWEFEFAVKFYPPDPTILKESLTRYGPEPMMTGLVHERWLCFSALCYPIPYTTLHKFGIFWYCFLGVISTHPFHTFFWVWMCVCTTLHKFGVFWCYSSGVMPIHSFHKLFLVCVCVTIKYSGLPPCVVIVQELCESWGGHPGLAVLTSLLVSVDIKLYWTMLRHWSQLVPSMSTDIWGH